MQGQIRGGGGGGGEGEGEGGGGGLKTPLTSMQHKLCTVLTILKRQHAADIEIPLWIHSDSELCAHSRNHHQVYYYCSVI